MNLSVSLIKQKNQKNCAIACLAMIMKYYQKSFDQREFIKSLEVDQYGYSLLDIASQLIKNGQKIEFGFWDNDLIKKDSFHNYPVALQEFEQYTKTIRLHKVFDKYLKEILLFFKKYPSSIKIEPLTLQKLDEFLKRKIPIIVHVDVKIYSDKTDDSIHSILVIGKENQKYTVLDPLLGKKLLTGQALLKSWRNGGGYYLVVLN